MPIQHRILASHAQGAEYVRGAYQRLRSHGSTGWGQVRGFLMTYPALVQGLYFFLTGLWPLIDLYTFQAVTGPKSDLWLVQTVGALVLVIGVVLLVAGYRRQKAGEVVLLAVGSALALATVDVVFVSRGRISAIYLLDAVLEVALIALWVHAWVEERRSKSTAATASAVPGTLTVQNGQAPAPLNRVG